MKRLVQSTVLSALSSAFSAIGLFGNNSNAYPSLTTDWMINFGDLNHITGAHKDFIYQSYSGQKKIITANGEN